MQSKIRRKHYEISPLSYQKIFQAQAPGRPITRARVSLCGQVFHPGGVGRESIDDWSLVKSYAEVTCKNCLRTRDRLESMYANGHHLSSTQLEALQLDPNISLAREPVKPI